VKPKTHPNLLIRSSLAIALTLALWSPAQAQPAEPATGKMREDKMMERSQAMKEPNLSMNEKGIIMKGFVQDIESLAIKNTEFRRVLYTAKNCQLVLMALKPKEEIGAETHQADQFFRVEEGSGELVLAGVRTAIRAGFAVVVPGGTEHNIINTGTVPLKLYTLYAPPNHRDGVVHHTRADAEADNEHFDGKTTE
jgi:mannose-6-phosphate isomerase-like protein (cupin superfamily)